MAKVEVKKLREEIQRLTSKRDTLIGERTSIIKTLSKKHGLKSVDDVEQHISTLQTQRKKLSKTILENAEELRKKLGW